MMAAYASSTAPTTCRFVAPHVASEELRKIDMRARFVFLCVFVSVLAPPRTPVRSPAEAIPWVPRRGAPCHGMR